MDTKTTMMRQILRLSLIVAFILAGLLPTHPASAGTTGWTHLLGTSYYDFGFGIAADGDSAIYLVGATEANLDGQPNAGPPDAYVARFDGNGTKLWTRLLGSPQEDNAYGVAVDPNGNIYVAGYTYGNLEGQHNAGNRDAYVSKFDSNGTKLWTRLIGTSSWDEARGVAVDRSGNVYVVGYTGGALDGQVNSGWSDAFISKFDSSGTKIWTRLLGSSRTDEASAIAVDSSGAVYIAGTTTGNLDGQVNAGGWGDAFVSKYDSSGNRQWTRLLGSISSDEAWGIAEDGNGAIYLTGNTQGTLDGQPNAGEADAFISKFNSSGTRQWTRLFGTPRGDYGQSVAIDHDGGIYLAGYTDSSLEGQPNSSDYDGLVSKYDGSGTRQWTRMFSTPRWDKANGVAVGSNGTVYIAGYTEGNLEGQANTGGADAFISRLGLLARTTGSLAVVPCTTRSTPVAYVTDPHDPANVLQLSISDPPPGLTVTVSQQQGTVTMNVTATCSIAPGLYPLTLTVSNSHGEMTITGINILVAQTEGYMPVAFRGSTGGW